MALLAINVIGGLAVIGRYVFGLLGQPGGVNALWGGVPENIRSLYGISMFVSAAGYLAVVYFLLFRLAPDEMNIGGRPGFGLFYVIFISILLPSAFWMPLTNMYVAGASTSVWIAIRTVLALVGLASVALVWALASLHTQQGGMAYRLAVLGSGYFAFHTAVLDALLWTALFK